MTCYPTGQKSDTLGAIEGLACRVAAPMLPAGATVGFRAVEERMECDIRAIERAELEGLAPVDAGAYPRSTVEVRERRVEAVH